MMCNPASCDRTASCCLESARIDRHEMALVGQVYPRQALTLKQMYELRRASQGMCTHQLMCQLTLLA
eukprot:5697426-Amphidinium_carterae.1